MELSLEQVVRLPHGVRSRIVLGEDVVDVVVRELGMRSRGVALREMCVQADAMGEGTDLADAAVALLVDRAGD
jgi:hypothetical protein